MIRSFDPQGRQGLFFARMGVALAALAVITAAAVPTLASEQGQPAQSSRYEPPAGWDHTQGPQRPPLVGPDQRLQIARAEAERSTPAAQLERQRSRTAHSGLQSSQARTLLANKFAPVLEELDLDPARRAAEHQVVRPLSDFSQLIASGSGRTALLESTTPLRVPNDAGVDAQVDLSLVSSGDGYGLRNPIIELALPGRADGQIAMPTSGIGLGLQGVAPSVASELDGNLFYPETHPDTDTVIAPIAQGVEIFEQIRSPQSPEDFAIGMQLPSGATLVEGPHGTGVLVRRDDDTLAHVPPPQAIDAQGTSVPAEMEIDGSTLRVSIDHRAGDWAYPILLDPAVRDVYYFPADPAGENDWVYASGNGAFPNVPPTNRYQPTTACTISATCNATWSLYIYPRPDIQYGPTEWGHWIYKAPGQTTYLVSALMTGLDYSYFYDVPRYFYPYTDGWSESNASYAQRNGAGNEWQGPGGVVWSNRSMFHNFNASSPTGDAAASDVEWMVAGVTTDACCYHGPTGWWRTFRLGGADITLLDPENPTLAAPSHTPSLPTGWVDQQSRTVGFSAQDPGLGVKRVELATPSIGGGFATQTRATGCVGGKRSTCPATLATPNQVSTFSYDTATFPQGERTVQLKAFDALEKVTSQSFTLKVDRDAPQIALSGGLPDPDEPGTDLHVRVTDGDPSPTAPAADKRSGVRKVEFLLDGQPVPADQVTPPGQLDERDCPASSCAREFDYNAAGRLTDGKHTYTVRATDQLGHQSEESFPVEIDRPTTGILDEYLMHYVDSPEDAEGNRDESELAVNVVNGNLVYRHTDAEVRGEDIDLTIDRYYNSQVAQGRGAFGNRWTMGGGADVFGVAQQSGDVTIHGPSAYEGLFVKRQDGSFGPSDDVHAATLKRTDQGGHDLTMEESAYTYHFNSGGGLVSESTANGSSLAYAYTGPRLMSARTSEGAEATFSYGPLNLFSDIKEMRVAGGTHVYEQDILNKLTRYTAPDGRRASYIYDADNRLTEIRHLSGATTRFTYDSQGRVTLVSDYSISSGTWATTSFAYATGTTTVTEPSGRATTYRVGKNGFVTKSQQSNAPSISLSGPLFENRGQTLHVGSYELAIDADGETPIDHVQIMVDDAEMEVLECSESCRSFEASWEFDTDEYLGGDAIVEGFAVDTAGRERSMRFEVSNPAATAPEPPAPPEESRADRFSEALDFRHMFGLETDAAYINQTLDDLDLADSELDYGVPLTPEEQDEIDERVTLAADSTSIDEYGASMAPDSYAGAYLDNAAGGLIYVGFTHDSEQHLDTLAADFPHASRLRPYATQPSFTLNELKALSTEVLGDRVELAAEGVDLVFVVPDVRSNRVNVGVTNATPSARDILLQRYGPAVEAGTAEASFENRSARQKPMRAGAEILRPVGGNNFERCTLGFGARTLAASSSGPARRGRAPSSFRALTAGHCGGVGSRWLQGGKKLGRTVGSINNAGLDVAAIRVSQRLAPRRIYLKAKRSRGVTAAQVVADVFAGQPIFKSGAETGVTGGEILNPCGRLAAGVSPPCFHIARYRSRGGDSGGPVYSGTTAVGIHGGRVTFEGRILKRLSPIEYSLNNLGLSNVLTE